jgi:hypothetical protein
MMHSSKFKICFVTLLFLIVVFSSNSFGKAAGKSVGSAKIISVNNV